MRNHITKLIGIAVAAFYLLGCDDDELQPKVVEVLPNVKTQKNLPSSYRVKANGQDLLYSFSYEFRPDGKVGKRIATRGNTSDIAVYHYY